MKPFLERRTVKEILELSERPTVDEVKRNYKRLVKQYHPDINKSPEAEECMKLINKAYDICMKKNPIPQQPRPAYESSVIFTVHFYNNGTGTSYYTWTDSTTGSL